jgi:hypothetical protein
MSWVLQLREGDLLREINYEEVSKALGRGQLKNGIGLNQEQCLQRPGDTRWSLHYKTLKSLVHLFPTIIKVLDIVSKDDRDCKNRDHVSNLQVYFESFDYILFTPHVAYINNYKLLVAIITAKGSRHCKCH